MRANQANIAGGAQQVNNCAAPESRQEAEARQGSGAPNELLEHPRDGEWLDTGSKEPAETRDSVLEALG